MLWKCSNIFRFFLDVWGQFHDLLGMSGSHFQDVLGSCWVQIFNFFFKHFWHHQIDLKSIGESESGVGSTDFLYKSKFSNFKKIKKTNFKNTKNPKYSQQDTTILEISLTSMSSSISTSMRGGEICNFMPWPERYMDKKKRWRNDERLQLLQCPFCGKEV